MHLRTILVLVVIGYALAKPNIDKLNAELDHLKKELNALNDKYEKRSELEEIDLENNEDTASIFDDPIIDDSNIGYRKENDDVKSVEMDIFEGGKSFKEIVKVDTAKGTEYYKTPKHGDRVGVEVLVDTATGVVANKMEGESYCLLQKRDPSVDRSAVDVKNGLQKSHGKFPYTRFTIVENKILQLPVFNTASLSQEIKSFCAGRQITKAVVENKDEASIEKDALKFVKDLTSKNERKRVVIREFIACNNGATMNIATCYQAGKKIVAKCRVRTNSCTYLVSCPTVQSGFNCNGVHKFSSILCCDFGC